MGPDQLSGVMDQVQRASAKSRGIEIKEHEIQEQVRSFREGVQRDSECYSTSAVVLDDGVIDPRDTREVLGMCLEVVKLPGVRGADSHGALARM